MAPITPSQTVGPFWHYGLEWDQGETVAGPDVPGEHILVEGRVFDGDGAPVTDAMIEVWQADAEGRYPHPDDPTGSPEPLSQFRGFGRTATDSDGRFRFRTIKPGAVRGPGNALQAPHLLIGVFARGLLNRLYCRMYFPDEPLNDTDPVLGLVDEARRATLVAGRDSGDATPAYRFDIRLRGENETVFFEC